MKKLFILSMLAILCISLNAQDTTIGDAFRKHDQTAVSEVIETIYDKTTEAISGLANALKVPAEHVYGVLVKQQIVESWGLLLAVIIFSILSYIFIKLGNDCNWRTEGYIPASLVSLMTLGVFIVLFIVHGLTGFFNPEYGAIKEIMSLF